MKWTNFLEEDKLPRLLNREVDHLNSPMDLE